MASLAGPELKRYCFDDVVVEPDCYRVLRDGEPQDLQPRAFDLLIYLIRHRDRVVDKQELFDIVWHGEAVTDNALTRAVKEIRRATGDDAAHPRHIETVQRRGYRFIASLNHDVPLESVGASVPFRARRPFPWATAKRTTLCVLAVLPLFVLAAHLWLTHGDTRVDLSGVRLFPFSTVYIEYGSPRWSPNGRTIAFCARNEGAIRLFVQSLDAPVPLCLTPQSMLAKYPFWGPDSRDVYFIKFLNNRAGSVRNGSLWKVSAAGGEPSLVQPEAHYATISPDGRTVASLRMIQQPRSFRLWTATPPQATPRPYEPAPFQGKFYINVPNAQFAPDAKKILVAANPDSTGEQVWLVPWPPGPGRRILQDLPGYGGTPQFSWMPDSRHVVLMQRTDRRQPYQILLADTVTSKWWPIHDNERNAVWPDASPDGTSVAYVSDLSNMDVVEVPVDGGTSRTLAGSSRHESMPTYSPDGRTIVYVADRRGFDELWAENLQDRRSWPVLTPSDFQSPGGPPFAFIAPAFSPDGQRIAVTSVNNAGAMIYVTGFETPAPVRLTAEEAFEQPPAWSPDGQWIAYYRMRPQRLRTLAKAKLGSSAPPVDLIENVDMSVLPEWSPNAEWIACAIVDKPGITLISPEGKPSRFLPGVSRPLTWSRDGKTIYQVRGTWEDSTLLAIDVVSGKERVIRDLGPLRPDSPVIGGWRVSASPDGKNLTWSVVRLRSEIWLLRGLRFLPPWYASLF